MDLQGIFNVNFAENWEAIVGLSGLVVALYFLMQNNNGGGSSGGAQNTNTYSEHTI